MEQTKTSIDISIWTVLKLVAIFLALKFLVQIQDIVLLFFIVLIIVAALSPVVDRLEERMNRVVAISLIYVVIFAVFSIVLLIVFPPFISQLQDLANNLPYYFNHDVPFLSSVNQAVNGNNFDVSTLATQFSDLPNQLYTVTLGFFNGIVGIFTVIVLTFYLLLEQHGAKKFITQYLPLDEREKVVDILQKIGNKMGAWMRGQLTLGVIIGVASGIGLYLLGIPYVLPLAVWAGFTELIPYVGPIIGAVPAIFLAFTISPLVGILTIAFYVVVQQLEANFLVPKIMQKAVGLSPVIIILALLIGAKIAGLLGAILAIPTAVIISVLVTEWPNYKQTFARQIKKTG